MRRGDDRTLEDGRGFASRLFARLGLWLAAFALLSQSLVVAAPPMAGARDARTAVAELAALLGPGVVVCASEDGSGAPAKPLHRHDECPLCRLAAASSAFDVPHAEPLDAPALALVAKLAISPRADEIPPPPHQFSLARGPPSET